MNEGDEIFYVILTIEWGSLCTCFKDCWERCGNIGVVRAKFVSAYGSMHSESDQHENNKTYSLMPIIAVFRFSYLLPFSSPRLLRESWTH